MCQTCPPLNRRGFLSVAAAGAVVGGFSTRGFAAAAAPSVSPDEALARLKEGNKAFLSAPQLCEADLAGQRAKVASSQAPWATVLACADSRVAPELVFGSVGLGSLFVARNAGNMADTATMGTIEYGAANLGVPLVVVLGHQSCGAVAAACAMVEKHARFPGSIEPMVQAIVPAARAVLGHPGDLVANAVRENARRTAVQIATRSQIVSGLVHKGTVKVIAAYYDLDTGAVEFLS